jgi:hypothetical protein
MGSIWRRPGLTAIEVCWRWLAAGPLLFCLYRWGLQHLPALQAVLNSLGTLTLLNPVESLSTLSVTLADVFRITTPLLRWLAPTAILVWAILGTIGQTIVLRRLQRSGHSAPFTIFGLRLIRSLGVFTFWIFWTRLFLFAARVAITRPAAQGNEPSAVLFVAMLIVGSLALFVGWAGISWPLTLAQVVAAGKGATAFQAIRNRKLRGQVLEVNLVLCIVKIALIVLALVFSACPLPFSSVETTQFLVDWTIAVILGYLVASDYFHVIRLAAFAALAQAEK